MRLEYRLTFGDYLLFSSIHQLLSVRLQVVYVLFPLVIYFTTYKKGQAAAIVGAILIYLVLGSSSWRSMRSICTRPGTNRC